MGAKPWGSLSCIPRAPCATPGPPGPGTAWAFMSGRRTQCQPRQCRLHPGSSGKHPCPGARRSRTATASEHRIPQLSCLTGPGARAPLSGLPVEPRRGFSGDQQQRPFRQRLLVPSWSAARQHRPLAPAALRPREGRGAALAPLRGNEGGCPWVKEAARTWVLLFLCYKEAFGLNTNLFKKSFFSCTHTRAHAAWTVAFVSGVVHVCVAVAVSWCPGLGLVAFSILASR